MKKIYLLISVALFCTTAFTQNKKSIFISAANANIQFVGRFDFSIKKQPVFMYSGSEIRTCFTGTSIQLHLKDDSLRNWFTVKLDDSLFIFESNNPNGIYLLANKLVNKKHTIEISRRTEWHGGNTHFLGFTIDKGKQLMPIKKRKYSIEFIGDSYTCGYGNEGASHDEHFSYATENNFLSYGAIAARALGADYTGICRSGIGIYQGYGGDSSFNMPAYYDEVTHDKTKRWNYSSHAPNMVVIDLSSNDFSAPVDSIKFTNAYYNFLKRIRNNYPRTIIICAIGPSGGEVNYINQNQHISAAVSKFNITGKAYLFEFGVTLMNGSDWHPNVLAHQEMAKKIIPFIRRLLK